MTIIFKTLRFKIFQPRAGKAEAFDELLDQNQKAVSHCFSVAKGHDIDDKEMLNHFIYHDHSDYPLDDVCNLPSAIKQTARDKSLEIYKSHKRRLGKYPQISQVPVVLDRRTFSLKRREGFFKWFVGITTNQGKKYVPLHVVRQHRYPARFLPDMLEGKLPIVKGELLKKDNEYWIHIIVKITINKSRGFSKPRAVYGIDLGEKRLATCASLRQGYPITHKDVHFFPNARGIRYRFSNARAWLQKKAAAREKTHDPSSMRLKGLRLGNYEKRAAKHLNHVISSQIQKDLQKLIQQGYQVTVVIGDLKHIRSSFKGNRSLKRRLHSWPFHQLQNFIKYKAEESGAEVKIVSEKGTSMTCYKCGSKGERPFQGLFICKCGKYNADLNAAINIANKHSGERIHSRSVDSRVVSDQPIWLN